MTRIYSNELKEGIMYSAPLFFDDGVNMFLAKRRAVKKYHIEILKKWAIPFILTYGTVVDDKNVELLDEESAELEEIESLEEEIMELKDEKISQVGKTQLEQIVKNFSINRNRVEKKIETIYLDLKTIFTAIKNEQSVSREKMEEIIDTLFRLVKEYPSETLNILITQGFESSYEIKAIISSIIGILIAEQISMKKASIKNLVIASLLHDIGMLSISKDLTEKQTKLTRQEFELLKLHLLKSARLASDHLYYPKEVGDIIMQHHERFDGSGYPQGLEKNAIHISARILSITDTFSAMVCRTSYGRPLSGYEAIKEITQKSEKKFDYRILKIFVSVLGYYPVGSYVLLNTAHIALVTKANHEFPYQPSVQILSKSSKEKAEINIGDTVNLQEKPHISIVQQIILTKE